MISLPIWLSGTMFLLGGGLRPWSYVPSRGGSLSRRVSIQRVYVVGGRSLSTGSLSRVSVGRPSVNLE